MEIGPNFLTAQVCLPVSRRDQMRLLQLHPLLSFFRRLWARLCTALNVSYGRQLARVCSSASPEALTASNRLLARNRLRREPEVAESLGVTTASKPSISINYVPQGGSGLNYAPGRFEFQCVYHRVALLPERRVLDVPLGERLASATAI